MSQQHTYKSNNKIVIKLVVIVVGMFGFGFALVPLYDVLCNALGINGKTSNSAAAYESVIVDESRLITVDFITRTNTGMSWKFAAETRQV